MPELAGGFARLRAGHQESRRKVVRNLAETGSEEIPKGVFSTGAGT
jgi:hypothetical protein